MAHLCFIKTFSVFFHINIENNFYLCSPVVQVKMNRMRLRIAQRLKEAQNTCAMLTTFNEVDMR